MTALENVLVGMNSRLRAGWFGAVVRLPAVTEEERRAKRRAQELLSFVGLGGRGGTLAKNLAYGDQRRLEIARALATVPKLLLLDEPTAGMNPRETDTLTEFIGLMRRELGLTILFPRMTVLENLELGAFTRTDRASIREDLERVFLLFPQLRNRRDQKGGTLSGGEQQMLAIGRALMARPKVLLLDEPSMGLSPILVEAIFGIIQDINRRGTTILLVEQNARMALQVAHRGYVLQTGYIVLHDSAPNLMKSDLVRKSYLGEK